MADAVKLDLGAGNTRIPGYTPVDIRDGQQAYPLPDRASNSIDAIRASHLLEHFRYMESLNVLREWARVVKPGGWLKLAVPDMDRLVEAYTKGLDLNVEGFLMGGQASQYDVHLSIWNETKLREAMMAVGLVDIQPWESEADDCAALPISLNLMGRKPAPGDDEPDRAFKVVAAMSVPRLGFMDNFYCAFRALMPNRIPIRRRTGAYWGKALQLCLMEILNDEAPDAILTLDYDTIFCADDVTELIRLMQAHPEADAIASWQTARWRDTPLLSIKGEEGLRRTMVPRTTFDGELQKIDTAHFGLTLIRTSALTDVPYPWFQGDAGPAGLWDGTCCDADVGFWKRWGEHGKTLYLANRVVVGHAELMIAWPDVNLEPVHQRTQEYWQDGKPEGVWK